MVAKTYMTMPEAATLLQCSERTVYTLIKDGQLREDAELVNGRPRKVVLAEDVERLAQARGLA